MYRYGMQDCRVLSIECVTGSKVIIILFERYDVTTLLTPTPAYVSIRTPYM